MSPSAAHVALLSHKEIVVIVSVVFGQALVHNEIRYTSIL